jgi:hypothetical protein
MKSPKLLLIGAASILFSLSSFSQVGIGTNNPVTGSSLHIEGGDSGVLINRVSLSGTDDVSTISSLGVSQEGLMVYNTSTTNNVDHKTDVYPGFYFWTGSAWQPVKKQVGNRNGWGFYVDGTYISEATGMNITKDIRTKLENDGTSTLTNLSEINDLGSNVWNTTHDAINPRHNGDAYDVRVTFKTITSAGGAANFVNLELDIGSGGIGTGPVIWQESKPMLKGASVITPFSFSIPVFALPPFFSTDYSSGQGGVFYVTSNVDITIWDIRIFIVRTYTN